MRRLLLRTFPPSVQPPTSSSSQMRSPSASFSHGQSASMTRRLQWRRGSNCMRSPQCSPEFLQNHIPHLRPHRSHKSHCNRSHSKDMRSSLGGVEVAGFGIVQPARHDASSKSGVTSSCATASQSDVVTFLPAKKYIGGGFSVQNAKQDNSGHHHGLRRAGALCFRVGGREPIVSSANHVDAVLSPTSG